MGSSEGISIGAMSLKDLEGAEFGVDLIGSTVNFLRLGVTGRGAANNSGAVRRGKRVPRPRVKILGRDAARRYIEGWLPFV